MGNPTNFVATVGIEVPEAQLQAASAKIKAALTTALEGVNIKAITDLANAVSILADKQDAASRKVASADKDRIAAIKAVEGALSAQEAKETAALNKRAAAIQKSVAEENKARAESLALSTKIAEELDKSASKNAAESSKQRAALQGLNAEYQRILTQQTASVAAQNAISDSVSKTTLKLVEQGGAVERAAQQYRQFGVAGQQTGLTLSSLFNTIAGQAGANILGGGGIGSSLTQALGQLQTSLAQISQGGNTAKAAFSALGIEGTGAVSALTAGTAGLAAGLLALAPIALDLGAKLAAAFGAAYEQQKQFVFDSGIVAKQLGTTVQEGAKLRSLLTLIGQENNIFATITLNQIQASLASLDRVEKGLEKPTQLVTKFGDTLKGLGVDFRDSQGNVKNFLDVVVELSGALGKLPASQRSLAVQNLAGLFGTDVAKLFGFSPEELTQVMGAAVKVTDELSQANDSLRVSIVGLSSAQTEFNIALAGGVTPLETYFNYIKSGALKEGANLLDDFFSRFGDFSISGPEAQKSGESVGVAFAAGIKTALLGSSGAFNALFPSREELASKRAELLAGIADIEGGGVDEGILYGGASSLLAFREELARIDKELQDTLPKFKGISGVIADEVAPSTAALTDHYKELDKALNDVENAEKAVADAQKDIADNNESVLKGFEDETKAIFEAASGYNDFYESIAQTNEKIAAIQAKSGKPFSFLGTGGIKDVEKALLDLRYNEARLPELEEKADRESEKVNLERLRKKIRDQRAALGLQLGEATTLENVDVTVGITGLGKKDKEKLNELFKELVQQRDQFLASGFAVAKTSILEFLGLQTGREDFADLLQFGANALQKFGDELGLFKTTGFAQATGEAFLKLKLLSGGFGEGEDAITRYMDAFIDLRKRMFDLQDYIADPKLLNLDSLFTDFDNYRRDPKNFKIPIAIELGLVSAGTVYQASLAEEGFRPIIDDAIESLGGTVEDRGGVDAVVGVDEQKAATEGARKEISNLRTGKGIIEALFASAGLNLGEAISVTAKAEIGLKTDFTLAQKAADAAATLFEKQEAARVINTTWNLGVTLELGPVKASAQIQNFLKNLGLTGYIPPGVSGPKTQQQTENEDNGSVNPWRRAAGGPVRKGFPYIVGDEGKPEMFVPASDGRILPGNQTADIMRGLGSRERLPSQAVINYSPVVQQTLNVDARGTNAREVTQAIQRAQAKNMFVSSAEFVRSRDAIRARGLRY